MSKKTSLIFLLLAAGMPALAANFSGKWTIQGIGGRGGRGGMSFTLTQVGNEVTGTTSARIGVSDNNPVNNEILGGKVDGDAITFYVWTGVDEPIKARYIGKMSPSGDEITFTVTGGRGMPGVGGPPPSGVAQPGRGGQTAGQAPGSQQAGGRSATPPPQEVKAVRVK